MVQAKVQNDEIVQTLFRSNHQLGVTTRFASAISHVNDIDLLTMITQSALIDFGLTGLFQIREQKNKYLKKFGNGLNRELFDRLASLKQCSDKIICKDSFIVFCLNHFTLVLDANGMSPEQIDETKDNLAIFCDIIDAWVTNYIKMEQYIESTENVKKDMLTKIEALSNNVENSTTDIKIQHMEVSQSLLLMLASRFPTLGLEPDQEDEILMSIEHTIEVYDKLINVQVKSNKDLKSMLNEAADCIQFTSQKNSQVEPSEAETNITLFD